MSTAMGAMAASDIVKLVGELWPRTRHAVHGWTDEQIATFTAAIKGLGLTREQCSLKLRALSLESSTKNWYADRILGEVVSALKSLAYDEVGELPSLPVFDASAFTEEQRRHAWYMAGDCLMPHQLPANVAVLESGRVLIPKWLRPHLGAVRAAFPEEWAESELGRLYATA